MATKLPAVTGVNATGPVISWHYAIGATSYQLTMTEAGAIRPVSWEINDTRLDTSNPSFPIKTIDGKSYHLTIVAIEGKKKGVPVIATIALNGGQVTITSVTTGTTPNRQSSWTQTAVMAILGAIIVAMGAWIWWHSHSANIEEGAVPPVPPLGSANNAIATPPSEATTEVWFTNNVVTVVTNTVTNQPVVVADESVNRASQYVPMTVNMSNVVVKNGDLIIQGPETKINNSYYYSTDTKLTMPPPDWLEQEKQLSTQPTQPMSDVETQPQQEYYVPQEYVHTIPNQWCDDYDYGCDSPGIGLMLNFGHERRISDYRRQSGSRTYCSRPSHAQSWSRRPNRIEWRQPSPVYCPPPQSQYGRSSGNNGGRGSGRSRRGR